ncbi:MAG: hypothetical protein NZU63_01085 [Gemmataceae bacterium]|nr:hypothetical protein [Gemmataceae bacterium]
MMMFPPCDLRRVAEYVRQAETEELLDRVTVYRAGMEPAALELMEHELDRRGISPEEIADHEARRRQTAIMLPDGCALSCHFCWRPAVCQAWGWYKLWGLIPLFPRIFARCEVHGDYH